MKPHSNEWYSQIAKNFNGYYYPWKSVVPKNNGEDTFLEYLHEVIDKDSIVLDVGCGHGDLILDVAPFCKEIYAYDRVPEFIDIAESNIHDRNNVHFIVGDSKQNISGDTIYKIPFENIKFDIVYSRRGPTNFINDLLRITKRGSKIIQLNPAPREEPSWLKYLPGDISRYDFIGTEFKIKDKIRSLLSNIGQSIDCCWNFDVYESFTEPVEFYKYLTWCAAGQPRYSYNDLEGCIKKIFTEYSTNGGISLRHKRFLWTAIIQ